MPKPRIDSEHRLVQTIIPRTSFHPEHTASPATRGSQSPKERRDRGSNRWCSGSGYPQFFVPSTQHQEVNDAFVFEAPAAPKGSLLARPGDFVDPARPPSPSLSSKEKGLGISLEEVAKDVRRDQHQKEKRGVPRGRGIGKGWFCEDGRWFDQATKRPLSPDDVDSIHACEIQPVAESSGSRLSAGFHLPIRASTKALPSDARTKTALQVISIQGESDEASPSGRFRNRLSVSVLQDLKPEYDEEDLDDEPRVVEPPIRHSADHSEHPDSTGPLRSARLTDRSLGREEPAQGKQDVSSTPDTNEASMSGVPIRIPQRTDRHSLHLGSGTTNSGRSISNLPPKPETMSSGRPSQSFTASPFALGARNAGQNPQVANNSRGKRLGTQSYSRVHVSVSQAQDSRRLQLAHDHPMQRQPTCRNANELQAQHTRSLPDSKSGPYSYANEIPTRLKSNAQGEGTKVAKMKSRDPAPRDLDPSSRDLPSNPFAIRPVDRRESQKQQEPISIGDSDDELGSTQPSKEQVLNGPCESAGPSKDMEAPYAVQKETSGVMDTLHALGKQHLRLSTNNEQQDCVVKSDSSLSELPNSSNGSEDERSPQRQSRTVTQSKRKRTIPMSPASEHEIARKKSKAEARVEHSWDEAMSDSSQLITGKAPRKAKAGASKDESIQIADSEDEQGGHFEADEMLAREQQLQEGESRPDNRGRRTRGGAKTFNLTKGDEDDSHFDPRLKAKANRTTSIAGTRGSKYDPKHDPTQTSILGSLMQQSKLGRDKESTLGGSSGVKSSGGMSAYDFNVTGFVIGDIRAISSSGLRMSCLPDSLLFGHGNDMPKFWRLPLKSILSGSVSSPKNPGIKGMSLEFLNNKEAGWKLSEHMERPPSHEVHFLQIHILLNDGRNDGYKETVDRITRHAKETVAVSGPGFIDIVKSNLELVEITSEFTLRMQPSTSTLDVSVQKFYANSGAKNSVTPKITVPSRQSLLNARGGLDRGTAARRTSGKGASDSSDSDVETVKPTRETKKLKKPPMRASVRLSAKNDPWDNVVSQAYNRASGSCSSQIALEDDSEILRFPAEGPGSVSLFKSDVRKLRDGEFLNDTIIEFALKYIHKTLEQSEDPIKRSCADDILVFSSFFYKRLTSVKNDPVACYERVRKWTKGDLAFKKKYIIMPINESLHWYLAIVVNPALILEATFDPEVDGDQKASAQAQSPAVVRRSSRFDRQPEDDGATEESESNETRAKDRIGVEGHVVAEAPKPAAAQEEGRPRTTDPDRDTSMADAQAVQSALAADTPPVENHVADETTFAIRADNPVLGRFLYKDECEEADELQSDGEAETHRERNSQRTDKGLRRGAVYSPVDAPHEGKAASLSRTISHAGHLGEDDEVDRNMASKTAASVGLVVDAAVDAHRSQRAAVADFDTVMVLDRDSSEGILSAETASQGSAGASPSKHRVRHPSHGQGLTVEESPDDAAMTRASNPTSALSDNVILRNGNSGRGALVGGGPIEPGAAMRARKSEQAEAKSQAARTANGNVQARSSLKTHQERSATRSRKQDRVLNSLQQTRLPIVITFDSLKSGGGQKHARVAKNLSFWLRCEARVKKDVEVNERLSCEHVDAYIPQQSNFSDCGVYVIHFFERFASDPDAALAELENCEKDAPFWQGDEVGHKREYWRSTIDRLSELWLKAKEEEGKKELDRRREVASVKQQTTIDGKTAEGSTDDQNMTGVETEGDKENGAAKAVAANALDNGDESDGFEMITQPDGSQVRSPCKTASDSKKR